MTFDDDILFDNNELSEYSIVANTRGKRISNRLNFGEIRYSNQVWYRTIGDNRLTVTCCCSSSFCTIMTMTTNLRLLLLLLHIMTIIIISI
jgi:hypothetical protein